MRGIMLTAGTGEAPTMWVAVAVLEAGQLLGGTCPGQRNGLPGTPGSPAKASAKHWLGTG